MSSENISLISNLVQNDKEPLGYPSISNIVQTLWEKSKDNLTPKELEWFARAHEQAGLAISNLHATIEGIGCLVLSDRKSETSDHLIMGNFQGSEDCSSLLFCINDALNHIGALHEIAYSATDQIRFGKNPK